MVSPSAWASGLPPDKRTTTDCAPSRTPRPTSSSSASLSSARPRLTTSRQRCVGHGLVFIATDMLTHSAQWFPEIDHHAPNIPIILVGTKLDLREDPATIDSLRQKRMEPVSYDQAL